MKTTTIKWRLKEQPTSENLRALVQDKLLTADEARQILFSQETEETREKDSLEAEIKFLRELVDKLSLNRNTTIVKEIQDSYPRYKQYPWYQPYYTLTSGSTAEGTYYTNITLI